MLENKEIEGLLSSSAQVTIESRGLDVWTLYLYAMKSPATKEKYLMRLGKFLDFLNLQKGGTLEDKSRAFAEKGRIDNIWAFNNILKFIQLLKERVDRKEITAGTIRNYVKSIKLFCQMADISIPWDKITRGIPKGRRYADDYITDVVALLAPVRSNSEEYTPSLSISIDNLPPNQNPTLNEYLDQTINAYYETLQEFRVMEFDTDSTLSGKPAYKLVSTDVEDGIDYKNLEIGTIIGDKVYFVTYDAEEEQYYDHLPIIQKMIGSLRIMSSSDRLDTDSSITEDSDEINPYAGR